MTLLGALLWAFPSRGQTIQVDNTGSAPSVIASMTTNKVTVAPFAASGVSIIPYNSQEFSALAATKIPPELSTALQPLVPYCILIRNENPQPVIAYTTSWTLIDKAGKVTTDFSTAWDVISLRGLIFPEGVALATKVGPIGGLTMVPGNISEAVSLLQQQASVSIMLDSVVFADGSWIGTDKSRAIPEMKARLNAERDLFRAVSARAGTAGGDSVLAWLQMQIQQPSTPIKFDKGPYEGWYQYYWARTAAMLARFGAQKGAVAVVNYINSVLSAKPYPSSLMIGS
jgi:hypothetical protein